MKQTVWSTIRRVLFVFSWTTFTCSRAASPAPVDVVPGTLGTLPVCLGFDVGACRNCRDSQLQGTLIKALPTFLGPIDASLTTPASLDLTYAAHVTLVGIARVPTPYSNATLVGQLALAVNVSASGGDVDPVVVSASAPVSGAPLLRFHYPFFGVCPSDSVWSVCVSHVVLSRQPRASVASPGQAVRCVPCAPIGLCCSRRHTSVPGGAPVPRVAHVLHGRRHGPGVPVPHGLHRAAVSTARPRRAGTGLVE